MFRVLNPVPDPDMRRRTLHAVVLAAVLTALGLAPAPLAAQRRATPAPNPIQREYQSAADRIIAAALADSAAWQKERGVRLHGAQAVEIEAEVGERRARLVEQADVVQAGAQQPADQVLERQAC